ncbi:MAG: DUF748 domain-containing protein [Candidatus Omnitrophica bacterium]|nr:DUF748 domain-containing protein [Candidatus Omnitrophota bacterium]
MRKKILLIIAIIAVIVTGGLYYINKVLLPVHIKGLILKAAQEQLNRNVTLDELHYNPLDGLVLDNLKIYAKDKPEETCVDIKRVAVQILFPALLQKKVVLTSVRIDTPVIKLVRYEKDLWNFNDLLPKAAAPENAKPPEFDIIVSGLAVTNGALTVTDLSLGDNFSETITPINLNGGLSLSIAANIAGNIAFPATKGTLAFNTRIGLNDKTFKGSFKIAALDLTRYLRFAPALPVDLKSANIRAANMDVTIKNTLITISGNGTVSDIDVSPAPETSFKGLCAWKNLSVTMSGGDMDVSGGIALEKIIAALPGKIIVTGSLKTNATKLSLKHGLISTATDLSAQDLMVNGPGQKFSADLNIPSVTIKQSNKGFSIAGDATLPNSMIMLADDQKISGTLALSRLVFNQDGKNMAAKTNLSLKDLAFNAKDITITADVAAPETSFTLKDGKLSASIHALIKKTAATLPGKITASGEEELSLHADAAITAPASLSYAGVLEVRHAALNNIPTAGSIKDISGHFFIETDSITTKDLSLTALDIPVAVSGGVSHFNAPLLNITAKATDVSLSAAEKVVPDIFKANELKVLGTADIHVTARGLLSRPEALAITATATIKNASAESGKLKQSVDTLSGSMEYKNAALSWKSLSFNYQGKKYLTNGVLRDFENPTIAASVETDHIKADARIKKVGNDIGISELNATWFDSSVALTGTIHLPPDNAPTIDLISDTKLALHDLPQMLPAEQAKQIDALKLVGVIKIKANISGDPVHWQDLASTATIETPSLSAMGYQMKDLKITATQGNGMLKPLNIAATVYSGELNIISSVDLRNPKFLFDTALKLENLNLDELKKDTPLKQQRLEGAVNITGEWRGKLLDLKNMTGKATVKISNGYLWDLEILSKVLSIVSSSFQGGNVIITDADATIFFENQRIMTNNLTLHSTAASILGEGWVDWDQKLDFTFTPRVESSGTSDTATLISAINPTAGLVEIKITGTISNPKYESSLTAPQIIKKTLQNTVGGLLKLFE